MAQAAQRALRSGTGSAFAREVASATDAGRTSLPMTLFRGPSAEKCPVTSVSRGEGWRWLDVVVTGQILETLFRTPSTSEYERAAKTVAANNALIIEVNEARELQEESKKDLAMAAGLNPAAVRRLFTQKRGKPTLTTVSAVVQALAYRLALVPIDDEVPARAVEGASGSGKRC